MLLQFPRTFYFFMSAWNAHYLDRAEPDVLLDLAAQLYPAQQRLIADAFLALRENDAERLRGLLSRLDALEHGADAGPTGRPWATVVPRCARGGPQSPDAARDPRGPPSLYRGHAGPADDRGCGPPRRALFRSAAWLEQRDGLGQDDRHHDLAAPHLRAGQGLDRSGCTV